MQASQSVSRSVGRSVRLHDQIKVLFESRLNSGNSLVTLSVCISICFYTVPSVDARVAQCQTYKRDFDGSTSGEGVLIFLFSLSRFSISLCMNTFEKKEHTKLRSEI